MNCAVTIYTKDYKVSQSSKEFQLIVPNSRDLLKFNSEKQLFDSSQWPEIISNFYDLSEINARKQRCLLLSENEISLIIGYPSRDSMGRPNVLIITGTLIRESWEIGQFSEVLSKTHSLILRLAESYSKLFSQNLDYLPNQLLNGDFLNPRFFDISNESTYQLNEWTAISSEILNWNNIRGIATEYLAKLGSNILIGTKHEASILSSVGYEFDGFYNNSMKKIEPLTENLERIQKVEIESEIPETPARKQPTEVEELRTEMHTEFQNIRDLIEWGFKTTMSMFLGIPQKPKKRKRKNK